MSVTVQTVQVIYFLSKTQRLINLMSAHQAQSWSKEVLARLALFEVKLKKKNKNTNSSNAQ